MRTSPVQRAVQMLLTGMRSGSRQDRVSTAGRTDKGSLHKTEYRDGETGNVREKLQRGKIASDAVGDGKPRRLQRTERNRNRGISLKYRKFRIFFTFFLLISGQMHSEGIPSVV